MEVKKSPKADLEGKKTTGLLIGYVLILAVMFVAFEWTDRDKQVTTDTGIVGPIFEEEMIPITEQEEKQPEQAPPPEAPKVEEVLQIADNDANVQETDIASSEETGQAVEIKYTPVEVEEEEPEEEDCRELVLFLLTDGAYRFVVRRRQIITSKRSTAIWRSPFS